MIAAATAMAGCATWGEMDRSEKGTAVGATAGALVGGAVAGPVGAAVGAGAGGYTGHHQGFGAKDGDTASARGDLRDQRMTSTGMYDADLVRAVQQSLNDRGYVIAIDGIWGPNTEQALRGFQQAQGLTVTGDLNQQSLSALGVRSDIASRFDRRVPPDYRPGAAPR